MFVAEALYNLLESKNIKRINIMGSSLFKMDMPTSAIKLKEIYRSKLLDDYKVKTIECEKIRDVYGELNFTDMHIDRPYTYTSLVTSIDGRLAFIDNTQGPLISRENRLDKDGALSDWWILNMLRASSSAVIIGSGTLREEKDYTGHVFDSELEDARENYSMNAVPTNIIISVNGEGIPFNHILFNTKEIPLMISTSSSGEQNIKKHLRNDCVIVGPIIRKEDLTEEHINIMKTPQDRVVVLLTGDKIPDIKMMLYVLKKAGFDKTLIETPSFAHALMEYGLLDEMFLNYSCLYLGGKSISIGQSGKGFTSKEHPHTCMLSIHSHSDSFFYFRHKLVYGK